MDLYIRAIRMSFWLILKSFLMCRDEHRDICKDVAGYVTALTSQKLSL
jgi:hypothetical protein